MPKRNIQKEASTPKKAKLEAYNYQELAVAQMIDLENDVHELVVEGEKIKLRREIAALSLPAGAGKTLVCVNRLLKWLDEPVSDVKTIPLAFNALMFSPYTGKRSFEDGRWLLFPDRNTEVGSWRAFMNLQDLRDADLADYGRKNSEQMLEECEEIMAGEDSVEKNLKLDSLIRRYYQTYKVGSTYSSENKLFRGQWPPGQRLNSPVGFGRNLAWADPCLTEGTFMDEIVKHKGEDGYQVKDLIDVLLSPRAGGIKSNSCLAIVPKSVYRQWISCLDSVAGEKRKRFVEIRKKTLGELDEYLQDLGGLHGPEKRVYIMSAIRCPKTMSIKKYIMQRPHDLIIQDEFHLHSKDCLPLTYNFLWAVSATPPVLPPEKSTAELFAKVLRGAVIRARWLTRLNTLYPDKPDIGNLVEESRYLAASGANFLINRLDECTEESDTLWGYLLEKRLAWIVSISPNPEEYISLPEYVEHTVPYRNPNCMSENSSEEIARVALAPVEDKKGIYRDVMIENYRKKLFRDAGSLAPNSPNFSSYLVLKKLAACGKIDAAKDMHRSDLKTWKSPANAIEELRRFAKELKGLGVRVEENEDNLVVDEVSHTASKLVQAIDKTSLQVFEKEFKNKIEEGCGICLDDATNTLLTACCKQATCATCAARIEAKCPFCRSNWEETLKTCSNFARLTGDGLGTLLEAIQSLTLKIIENNSKDKILIVCSLDTNIVVRDIIPTGVSTLYCINSLGTNLLRKFQTEASVLILNERVLNYGVDFQFVDHLIIMDGVPESSMPQIIGRVQRLGRVKPAQIYYLKCQNPNPKPRRTGSSMLSELRQNFSAFVAYVGAL